MFGKNKKRKVAEQTVTTGLSMRMIVEDVCDTFACDVVGKRGGFLITYRVPAYMPLGRKMLEKAAGPCGRCEFTNFLLGVDNVPIVHYSNEMLLDRMPSMTGDWIVEQWMFTHAEQVDVTVAGGEAKLDN